MDGVRRLLRTGVGSECLRALKYRRKDVGRWREHEIVTKAAASALSVVGLAARRRRLLGHCEGPLKRRGRPGMRCHPPKPKLCRRRGGACGR